VCLKLIYSRNKDWRFLGFNENWKPPPSLSTPLPAVRTGVQTWARNPYLPTCGEDRGANLGTESAKSHLFIWRRYEGGWQNEQAAQPHNCQALRLSGHGWGSEKLDGKTSYRRVYWKTHTLFQFVKIPRWFNAFWGGVAVFVTIVWWRILLGYKSLDVT